MKRLLLVHNYLTEIVYRIHVRIREQQKEESRQATGVENANKSGLYLTIARETLQLFQAKPSMQLLQKDYVEHMMKTFQVSKYTGLAYVTRMSSDGIVFVDRSLPSQTMLTFNLERLSRVLEPTATREDHGPRSMNEGMTSEPRRN